MIISKFWRTIRAQINKLANLVWAADPIAQMQYEYDSSVDELKQGREGLAQYRALVERVTRQVAGDQKHVTSLNAKIKAYLQAGDRETAARFALELQTAKTELSENESQLAMHEQAYENNLKKIKHAGTKLSEIREKISKYDAELKMSRAEAEMAKLSESFDMKVTTDFGRIEQVIQDRISLNHAKARVSADLSSEGLVDIEREEAMQQTLADDALRDFEIEMGLVTPQTVPVSEETKELGPSTKEKETTSES